jgi:hypothetical protein
MRKYIAMLFTTSALAVGAFAPTASSAPVITGGLVNLTVTNVLNNNTVTLDRTVNVAAAVKIAANVCDVPVTVLASSITQTGSATCTNTLNGGSATITQP